jgi:hypothetical protein
VKSHPQRDVTRSLRVVGGIAAILAVIGLVVLAFWLMTRLPRF